ncbi:hypothetical protein BJX99DRAFT_255256 [Aspergillus californicus]
MHLSNLLLATSLSLLPAISAYSVATVEISYHEACYNGEIPTDSIDSPESTVVTKDTCTQLPAKHSFEIDGYSFSVTPITKDTARECHAVGVYVDEECEVPVTVLPLFESENGEGGRCIQDGYFGENVSVKLICEDREGRHEDEDHEEGHEDEDHEEGDEDRDTWSQKPKGKGGLGL